MIWFPEQHASRRQSTGKGVGCPVLAPGKALVRSPMGGWEVVPAEPRIVTDKRKRSENGKHKKIKDASRANVHLPRIAGHCAVAQRRWERRPTPRQKRSFGGQCGSERSPFSPTEVRPN